jgi:vacuolar-type H+-ATPase subunit C/Vma6
MGERAYACAKACGIIGRSFVGRRTAALGPVTRLSELDRLVFGDAARELPEKELLGDLERRLSQRGVAAILSVLRAFRKPPHLFQLLLRVYEYSDLKTALILLAEKDFSSKPAFTQLGRFGKVNFDAWPDAKAMLSGTDLQFVFEYLEKDDDQSGISMETALDRHYYSRLWASLDELNKKDRMAARKIISEEISLRNCAWMLRLRSYYGMKAEETERHLIVIENNKKLCEDALSANEFFLDERSGWEKWKRVRFLNPDLLSGQWKADPRFFQNAASEYLYQMALRYFRTSSSSINKLFCFIKLKQFEEDLLTSNAEGLGMGLPSREVLAMLELS